MSDAENRRMARHMDAMTLITWMQREGVVFSTRKPGEALRPLSTEAIAELRTRFVDWLETK